METVRLFDLDMTSLEFCCYDNFCNIYYVAISTRSEVPATTAFASIKLNKPVMYEREINENIHRDPHTLQCTTHLSSSKILYCAKEFPSYTVNVST